MPDPTMIGGGKFASVFIKMIEGVAQNGKKEVRSLKALSDRKFKEIEAAHKTFSLLLRKLAEASNQAYAEYRKTQKLNPALKKLTKVIKEVEETRSKGEQSRRTNYEEAHIYARYPIQERGIFRKIPGDISAAVTNFMLVYAHYFQSEGSYMHELAHALDQVRMSVHKMESGRMHPSEDISSILKEIHAETTSWLRSTRDRWPEVAEAYHVVNLSFREHGLI